MLFTPIIIRYCIVMTIHYYHYYDGIVIIVPIVSVDDDDLNVCRAETGAWAWR